MVDIWQNLQRIFSSSSDQRAFYASAEGNKILERLDEELMPIYITMMVCINMLDVSNANGLKDGKQCVVNHNQTVLAIIAHMRVIPQFYKILTIFMILEF